MKNTYKTATGTVTITATGLIHKTSSAYSGKIAAAATKEGQKQKKSGNK
jgi:hypothetical protein|tara:strand:- start:2755 stop:2901 length:147 start_codon:yes stop_codon:yes gene_type:complete